MSNNKIRLGLINWSTRSPKHELAWLNSSKRRNISKNLRKYLTKSKEIRYQLWSLVERPKNVINFLQICWKMSENAQNCPKLTKNRWKMSENAPKCHKFPQNSLKDVWKMPNNALNWPKIDEKSQKMPKTVWKMQWINLSVNSNWL